MFKSLVFLINSGKLFRGEGPTNEIVFCPMFVSQKGILSFEKFVLYLFYNVEQIQKFENSEIQKLKNSEICFSNKIILIYITFRAFSSPDIV